MMKLSTLWRVDQTIDADGRSPIADRIAACWDFGDDARFFRSSANFTYRIEHGDRPAFLRFADSGERTRAAIEQEMRLLQWLDRHGMTVNLPIASRQGRLVETVETSAGTFHAVLLTALEGGQPDIDDLDKVHFRQWGAALGRLHRALANIPSALRRSTPPWRTMFEAFDSGRGVAEGAAHESQAIQRELAALPVTPTTFGPIHTDFELDNLIWQPRGIGTIDFDEYTDCWRAADIAKALTDRLETGASFDDPLLAAFVAGYRTMFPLTEAQLATVPLMLRLRKLHDYAVLKRTCDLPADVVGPDWLLSLNLRLREWMLEYEQSIAIDLPG